MIKEINGYFTCTLCEYEWSAMLSDDEIPNKCKCERENKKVTTQFVTKADYVYKRKNGGTTLCYGTLEEDSNFFVVCDNEHLDGVWAERDPLKQKSWKDVCEHLEEVYDENIEQLETD